MHCPLFVVVLLLIGGITGQGDPDPWILESDEMPEDLRLVPAVGNGHIATQVYHDTIYMNNLFNGYMEDSHRARIVSPVAISVSVAQGGNPPPSVKYSLDMYRGIFLKHMETEEYILEQRIYAHKSRTRILVNEFTITRLSGNNDQFIFLTQDRGDPSPDIGSNTTDYNGIAWMSAGRPYEPEDGETLNYAYVFWEKFTPEITFPGGEAEMTWQYITSVSNDQSDAETAFNQAMTDRDELLDEHVQAWASLWEAGQISVPGNVTLAQTLNAALFHILISCPDENDPLNQFTGLSPGGLARGGKTNLDSIGGPFNDYAGHVFWDMDTWIMPPIMMLHPHLASVMITARTSKMDVARGNAAEMGYEGIRFVWEQAFTGLETCPWPPAALYQFHVTADASYSLRQYLYATEDLSIVTDRDGKELAMEIARFWASRIDNKDDMDEERGYEIYGVMGPDENAYPVNNSVFTNYQARLSLDLPAYLRDKLGIEFTAEEEEDIDNWTQLAPMFIVFDEERQFHPQYEHFDIDDPDLVIKQSDVVLLGYPLMMDMERRVRRNDLVLYEEVTDTHGPDTGTWSMHTVGWLELDDYDQANDMFYTMFRNINGPFKIFSEKPDDANDTMRAVNFITGAGGMMQAVMFGYAGMRLRMYQLDLYPWLLPEHQPWQMQGVNYRGYTFNLDIDDDDVTITVTSAGSEELNLCEWRGAEQGTWTCDVLEGQGSFRRGGQVGSLCVARDIDDMEPPIFSEVPN